MYCIHKITLNPTVDFAAEELKKYLRMMMPRCGEVAIDYDAKAEKGFRIGLMQDFGLDISDAEKPDLDDIVYVETDENGGIIAGSNPGATLIAVYRYLRKCGCRWLFPGVDGEWIPVVEGVPAVSYRKKASYRYRGQCNEGAEYQQNMMEAIDFTPKIGMNTFMQEFDIPSAYYNLYYDHKYSTCREPEPINNETVLQWKRQCETEIEKRGLHFHDMGHGWTAEPYGIDSTQGWKAEEVQLTEAQQACIAELDGVRQLYKGVALNTNICFSNPEARRIQARYIADYAEKQNNVDFLHIWLADANNNHCECENCRKKRVADWYVMMLNEVDEELTRRGLNTRLVFIQYYDTFWGPVEETLRNQDRFTMLYAPITRLYTETYQEDADVNQVEPYVLNRHNFPKGMAACLGYLKKEWKPVWKGDCFCYEYHFWTRQWYDPTGLHIAKTIHKDVVGLRKHGLHGIIEDGSQRSYFPTGLAFYVYGETLFDSSVTFEELVEDYFSHAFGEKWREVYGYLESVSACFDYDFMAGHKSVDLSVSKAYNPDMAKNFAPVKSLTDAFAPVIAENKDQPKRASSVSWRLLDAHRDLVCYIADAAMKRALGDDAGAVAVEKRFKEDFSRREIYMQTCFDYYMCCGAFRSSGIFERRK